MSSDPLVRASAVACCAISHACSFIALAHNMTYLSTPSTNWHARLRSHRLSYPLGVSPSCSLPLCVAPRAGVDARGATHSSPCALASLCHLPHHPNQEAFSPRAGRIEYVTGGIGTLPTSRPPVFFAFTDQDQKKSSKGVFAALLTTNLCSGGVGLGGLARPRPKGVRSHPWSTTARRGVSTCRARLTPAGRKGADLAAARASIVAVTSVMDITDGENNMLLLFIQTGRHSINRLYISVQYEKISGEWARCRQEKGQAFARHLEDELNTISGPRRVDLKNVK
ncbi:unnamed protein product, partial [Trichogramma brassicae]